MKTTTLHTDAPIRVPVDGCQVLLFVDLLGVKSRWKSDGRSGVESAFKDFRNSIAASLKDSATGEIIDGVIESDSAALVFKNAAAALKVGSRLYNNTFLQTERNKSRRYWLRGAVVPRSAQGPLRTYGAFSGRLSSISLVHYESELLDAISIEKSGIKGMRLIVDSKLITAEMKFEHRISHGNRWLIPFRKLRHSFYPKEISETHQDFLWMARSSALDRQAMAILMSQRLRLASEDAEELAQAAATQVMFHEYAAMAESIEKRANTLRNGAKDR